VPEGAVTVILPVCAKVGTVAWIVAPPETMLNVDVAPLNFTLVAPVNPVPLIVTVLPSAALVGVNDVIVGAVAIAGTAMNVRTTATAAIVRWTRLRIVPPDPNTATICQMQRSVATRSRTMIGAWLSAPDDNAAIVWQRGVKRTARILS
jgi:hypothetical protein